MLMMALNARLTVSQHGPKGMIENAQGCVRRR